MPGYTTPDNLRYPLPGDPEAPLEDWFKKLAEDAQAAISTPAPPTWESVAGLSGLVLASGFAASNLNNLFVARQRGTLTMAGLINGPITAGATPFTLPAGYRHGSPANYRTLTAESGAGARTAIAIASTGGVTFTGALGSGVIAIAAVTWPLG